MRPASQWISGALAGLVLLACASCSSAQRFRGTPVDPPQQAPEIVGANWDGSEFRLSGQRGKVLVLFFGYASCPDVCPMTLSRMKNLYGRLGHRAADVAVVFISVDPGRDSRDKLAAYVPAFDERFYGLHLGEEVLSATTAGYDVVVERHPPRSPGGYYAVDHTGTLFVIDPDGMLRVQFAHDAPPEELLPDILLLLEESGQAA